MLEGLLIVDKPVGLTSHDVVQQIRRLSHIRRVGHAGTLDPLATGVLLVCLGRATRLIEYVMGQPKTYLGTVRLGQITDSYDAEGEITQTRPVTVNQEEIAAALPAFRGRIDQVPPRFSAIKKAGQPVYKLARQGIMVDLPARPVTIYDLEILAWQPPDLRLRIVCSAGTYIRSLAHDLGQQLGCGGHLVALRRTAIGLMMIEAAASLSALTPDNWQATLLPPEAAVAHLPPLNLTAVQAGMVMQGQRPLREPDQLAALLLRGYDERGRFLGVFSPWQDRWQVEKLIQPVG